MFNKLKVVSALLIGFGALLLLLAGASGFSVLNSLHSKDSIQALERQKNHEVLDQRIETRLFEGRMRIWMALGSGDKAHWAKSDEAFDEAHKRLAELAATTEDPARRQKVQKMDELVKGFREVGDKFRAFGGQNDAIATAEGKAVFASALKIGADMTELGESLGEDYGDAAKKTETETDRAADIAISMVAGVGLASLVIGLVLAFLISRSISVPIVRLTKTMEALAEGELEVEIPYAGLPNEIGAMARSVEVFKANGLERVRLESEAQASRARAEAERERNEALRAKAAEEQASAMSGLAGGLRRLAAGDLTSRLDEGFSQSYAQIRDDFNAAVVTLKQTMLTVISSATTIRSGTRDISTASDDLSKRTERQAASLEETAAALDEITAAVKKSADGARHAREVVTTADEDAKRSAVIVRQTVGAMDSISRSAQQISQIIGVIDEIAFQTNLLALNAGVEAARAGETGRGFAVVASEVRALAQRSAEAAKEIKGLISASTAHVEEGVKLVAATGESLERIMTKVGEINEVVSAIASGAQEQAAGLQQVNTAINQMDQVTQQNAAMVEESTAASSSLSQETEELAGLIGRFQVGASAHRRGAPRELDAVA